MQASRLCRLPGTSVPCRSPSGLDAVLRASAARLAEAGVDSPALSAELLVAEAMGLPRQELLKRRILRPGEVLAPAVLETVAAFTGRRASGEPAAYILGRKEFFGRNFLVTRATLIPRPETELLIETALAFAAAAGVVAGRFADFGAGSGAIAVTMALELPGWRGLALDNSSEALKVAQQNAARLEARNLDFCLADFTSPLDNIIPADSLDMLLSNPPYVSETEYADLSHEVRDYEPKQALVPGPLGTEHAAAICREAARALRPGGLLLMEIGIFQSPRLQAFLNTDAWSGIRLLRDLAGHLRLIAAQRATRSPP